LAILLQLCDELIALLQDVGVLLILVVRPVRLNNALNAINGAGDAVGGNEFGEIPNPGQRIISTSQKQDLPVEEVDSNAEIIGHAR
jgi:hypothetical protein